MNDYGADFITIVDEDGVEYELEVLATLDYQGAQYVAVIPAGSDEDESPDLEVNILTTVEENGEFILEAIQDEAELEAVSQQMMDMLYDEAEGEDDED